jgi:hypothetical protein
LWHRAQCTVELANVDIVVVSMSSRSRFRAFSLSTVPSRIAICELSSHGPAPRNPSATVACGSSGYSASPASCSATNRPYGLSSLNDRTR